ARIRKIRCVRSFTEAAAGQDTLEGRVDEIDEMTDVLVLHARGLGPRLGKSRPGRGSPAIVDGRVRPWSGRPSERRGAASARLLGLQLGVVRLDEGADVVGHVEQLDPLLLVDGDGKTAVPVDGHVALLYYYYRA